MNSFEAFSNSSVSFMNSFDFLGIVLNCLGIVLRFLGIALGILGIALGSSQRHQINRPRQPLTFAFLPVNDISRFQQLPDFWVGPCANPSKDLSKKMALRLCIYHWGLWFIMSWWFQPPRKI